MAKRALKAAKELERLPLPTDKEIVQLYKEGLEEARKLQKLLKPEWFVEDTDAAARESPDRDALRIELRHHGQLPAKKRVSPAKRGAKKSRTK